MLAATLCAAAVLLVAVPHAAGGPVRPVSPHWAGYVDTGTGAFTAVQATWVQPRIRCERPSSSVAFWVGLGGATATATGLEQIGTLATCSDNFLPSYSAWYELIPVPADPVDVPVTVAPGDRLRAQVSVQETTVALAIRNLTTGRAFSTQVTAASLDLSSADWIVEAPPYCLIRCVSLPLAGFGTVTFKGALASAGDRTGTIGDSAWTRQAMRLANGPTQPSAVPSALSGNGGSFSVRWRDATRARRHRR